jgi:hypothetical protein
MRFVMVENVQLMAAGVNMDHGENVAIHAVVVCKFGLGSVITQLLGLKEMVAVLIQPKFVIVIQMFAK